MSRNIGDLCEVSDAAEPAKWLHRRLAAGGVLET